MPTLTVLQTTLEKKNIQHREKKCHEYIYSKHWQSRSCRIFPRQRWEIMDPGESLAWKTTLNCIKVFFSHTHSFFPSFQDPDIKLMPCILAHSPRRWFHDLWQSLSSARNQFFIDNGDQELRWYLINVSVHYPLPFGTTYDERRDHKSWLLVLRIDGRMYNRSFEDFWPHPARWTTDLHLLHLETWGWVDTVELI